MQNKGLFRTQMPEGIRLCYPCYKRVGKEAGWELDEGRQAHQVLKARLRAKHADGEARKRTAVADNLSGNSSGQAVNDTFEVPNPGHRYSNRYSNRYTRTTAPFLAQPPVPGPPSDACAGVCPPSLRDARGHPGT